MSHGSSRHQTISTGRRRTRRRCSELKPSAHSPSVTPPLVAEAPLQLLFLKADESIHQREVQRANDQRRRRSEQQRRSEEDEHVAAEIQWIPRKAIRPRGDERGLWRKRDHAHLVDVEIECRPGAQEESEPSRSTAAAFAKGNAIAEKPNSESTALPRYAKPIPTMMTPML